MTMLAYDANGATAPVIFPGASQKLSFSGTSAQSAAVGDDTTIIRVVAMGADCRVAIGADPTADANSMPVMDRVPEYFAIQPGDKVAAIQEGSTAGVLNITEGANHR